MTAIVAAIIAGSPGWVGHMGNWGWGMAITGWVFMLAVIGLVAWGIVSLGRAGASRSPDQTHPLDIAETRYARGEITREEYLQIKADLQK